MYRFSNRLIERPSKLKDNPEENIQTVAQRDKMMQSTEKTS